MPAQPLPRAYAALRARGLRCKGCFVGVEPGRGLQLHRLASLMYLRVEAACKMAQSLIAVSGLRGGSRWARAAGSSFTSSLLCL